MLDVHNNLSTDVGRSGPPKPSDQFTTETKVHRGRDKTRGVINQRCVWTDVYVQFIYLIT